MSAEFPVHCVVSLPSVKIWMEGIYDMPYKKKKKKLFLRDYWT